MVETNSHTRSSLLTKNILASFIVKGWSALVVLLMVPLTLKMLGIYSNGVWLTISGILMWVDFLDVGLGNGLRNAVANNVAKGEHEKVREAISSAFFMLFVIVVPILMLLYAIIYNIDVYSALGVSPTRIQGLEDILATAVTLVCSTFILKSVGNFYMGMQLPAVNNFFVCMGQTLALIITYIAYLLGSNSLLVVVIINTASPLFVWMLCVPYSFWIRYPQYAPYIGGIKKEMSRSLFSTSMKFFVLQICAIVLFTSTNIIISRIFSPAEVTPYQVAYRYFSLLLVAFTIICMPFWNATTDAYARGEMEWIQRMSRKLDIVMAGIFIAMLLMIAVSKFVYGLWVGKEVEISYDLSIAIGIYIFILIVSMRYSYLLNGMGVLKLQLIFTVVATVVYLPLAWLVCHMFGTVVSLAWVMCSVHVPGLIVNVIQLKKVINGTATGIWLK